MTSVFRHIPECFGCGQENPRSLGIVHASTGDGAEARVRFGSGHQGAPGLVHGGLLASLLDEAMGAVPVDVSRVRLTAEMNVRYRRPTPVETDLLCRARVDTESATGFTVRATIVRAASPDVVLVEGTASYVIVDDLRPPFI